VVLGPLFLFNNIFIKKNNMLFNLSYKNNSGEQFSVFLSGSNMSAAILYCDANNFSPIQISIQNSNLLLSNPSSQTSYLVGLKDSVTEATSSIIIFDTFSNVESWINSQTNKIVTTISLQNRAFVQA
jgi:hypothetical protein